VKRPSGEGCKDEGIRTTTMNREEWRKLLKKVKTLHVLEQTNEK
jgi:hypothetical protein